MKAFFKKNSDLIVKMIIHQFGLTVFGLLLNTAASVSGNDLLVILLSVFSSLFYLVLLYFVSWDEGARDKIKIDGKRLEFDPLKGLKLSLAANMHNFIVAILSLLGYLCINKELLDEAGHVFTPGWAISLYAIFQPIGIYIHSMYTGIGQYLNIEIYPYFILVLPIPALLVSFAAYYFGTKNKFGFYTGEPKRK